MTKRPPKWHEKNLITHYQKHPAGKKCQQHWNNVLGVTPEETISIDRYEDESEKIVRNAWYVYEAQEWDPDDKWYRETCTYYIDDRLLRAITIYDRGRGDFFKTCYDYHFPNDGETKEFYPIEERKSLGSELKDAYQKEIRNLIDAGISGTNDDKNIKPGSYREILNGNK